MSEVKKLDPTIGGDALVVETIKTDDVGNAILQSTESSTPENIDVTSENVTAPAEETRALTETKCLVEISSENVLEKTVNPSTCVAPKIIGTTGEIMNLIAEDASAIRVDTQTSVAEIDNSTAITIQGEETKKSEENEINGEKVDKSMQNTRDNNETCVSRLEAELREKTKERDVYRKKLEDTETKLAALQASYDTIRNYSSDENTSQSVEQLNNQLVQTALMYEERNRVVANQENQINALNNQVVSLKEVVSITRDLLQIRNMEVKQLQAEVDNMEKKISEERDRHNTMINKMDTAMRLNADLKKEYETQLSLFQSLREKYGEKITLLTGEKHVFDKTASQDKTSE